MRTDNKKVTYNIYFTQKKFISAIMAPLTVTKGPVDYCMNI
jgi:hypothetical protein